jgi:site-specific recombinase XerD
MEECLQNYSKAGARDRAMIALAWQLGPRVHEIAGLNAGLSSLSATSRTNTVSRARFTADVAPSPSFSRISYLPSF